MSPIADPQAAPDTLPKDFDFSTAQQQGEPPNTLPKDFNFSAPQQQTEPPDTLPRDFNFSQGQQLPSKQPGIEDVLTGAPADIGKAVLGAGLSAAGDVLSTKVGPEIPGTSKAWDIATGHRMPWEPPIGGKQPQPAQPQPQDTRPQVPSELRPLLREDVFPTKQPTTAAPAAAPAAAPTPAEPTESKAQTTPIWQAFAGDTGLNKLADHVIAMEGDSRVARQNNNPGNLKDPATGKFMKFGSYEEGRKALLRQLGHWRDQHPNWSIADFNRVYAPDRSRGGDNPEGTEDNRNQYLMNAIRLAGGVEAKAKDQ